VPVQGVHFTLYRSLNTVHSCRPAVNLYKRSIREVFKPVNNSTVVWPKAGRVFTLDIHYFAIENEKLHRLNAGGL
jgi:predicted Zn-dependent protease with MMP-like domain